ncbi:MAG: DEAD/DEAH box helicase [Alkalibacterium sp.]|nr:DEAD/DEAH box helicase [Alkalibacterium sp.]
MTESMIRSLKKAFIDHSITGSHYDPKLIINDVKKKEYMLNVLHDELNTCEHFFFSVAFLTQDGLASLKAQFADLNKRGARGRILTSVYLAFNQPDVFKDLLTIPNIEVRLSKKEGFHSKGYLFKHKSYHSFIVGSSNLTMSALKVNYEWNVKLTSHDHGQMIQDINDHMESEWHEADLLTPKWIEDYRATYKPMRQWMENPVIEDSDSTAAYITPNIMQKDALRNLANLRARGENKGMVVSATGTGKTYLSAFDVAQAEPEKVLFVVHREQILSKAKEDYKRILGGEEADYGMLSGSNKERDAKYIFATVQTLSKGHILEQFAKDQFDYILIDEVHKAGAKSYHQVLDYFEPKFLLGMTATPERTDGFNIFELFDYNIAYEIRLQEALEENLLCPFHYFGVTEFEKNGELITETTDINQLVEEERVDYLIEKLNYYGCSRNNPKGLVFCSRKEEAKTLSRLFNERGYLSTYLSGEDSLDKREKEVTRLEKGQINYIFTVDIFNEGIDIPKINQVIMLRNTQSSIIFIQQLGRGLRKDESKDYVTVIDFIGNYKNNYMIPMALSGDTSRNKNGLRKDTYDTHFISGVSTINFEEIAKKQIFQSINHIKLDSMFELRKEFNLLYNRIGRVPYLKDFQENQKLDPYILATKKKSYYDFLVGLKQNEGILSKEEQQYLMIASREFLSGMRKHELIVLKKLIDNQIEELSVESMKQLFQAHALMNDDRTIQSVLNTLTLQFYTASTAKTYGNHSFVTQKDGRVQLTLSFKKAFSNDYFKKLFIDLIETGLLKTEGFNTSTALTRYQKYKRKDVLRLLNWEEQMVDQNIGGYTAKNGEFVIFITLQKGEDFTGALMAYEDELIDSTTLKWFTKSPRTLNSPEVKKLQDPKNWAFRVFAKKSDDEGTDFYYLGKCSPVLDTIEELEKPIQDGTKKSVVEMLLKFEEPIENSLFHYLTLND